MRLRPHDPDERGAIAILTALLAVVVLAMAALGVDIATQVNERQKLHDTIDAAALAGAYQLPGNGGQAKIDALAFAHNNDPAAPAPDVVVLCVVGSIWNAATSTYVVDPNQILATCNRSAGTSTAGSRCNATICSLPCTGATDRCNVIKVVGAKPVPFSFAPAIGINQGSTGSVTSAACKGACGTAPLNPMDVVVVADRTASMIVGGHDYTQDLVDGVRGMLLKMTPSQQYVALGTIGRSTTTSHSTAPCNSSPSPSGQGLSWPSGSSTTGAWVPVNFSNNYLSGTLINAADPLVKGVDCLTTHSGTGTSLASPMKFAARYLLGSDPALLPPASPTYDANNLGSLPARTGTVTKAIIFETDGVPSNENVVSGGTAALSNTKDFGSSTAGTACTNLKTVAQNAKDAGILVVTVAFNASTAACGASTLIATLAAAASNAPSGSPSVASNDCSTAPLRDSENRDLDYFFCAAPGDLMGPIFVTALEQIANGSRLIELP